MKCKSWPPLDWAAWAFPTQGVGQPSCSLILALLWLVSFLVNTAGPSKVPLSVISPKLVSSTCTGLSSPSSPRSCKHASPDGCTAASQTPPFIQFISKSFLVLIPLPPHRPKQVFLYLRIVPAVRSLKSLLWQQYSSGGLDPSAPYFLLLPTQTLGISWKETSQASSKASLLRSLCLHWRALLYMKYALPVPGQKTPTLYDWVSHSVTSLEALTSG